MIEKQKLTLADVVNGSAFSMAAKVDLEMMDDFSEFSLWEDLIQG